MATIPKTNKDKPHGVRILPRPTAASAARAAMNRNIINTPADHKAAPSRSRSTLSPKRKRSPSTRSAHPQIESKSDMQINNQHKNEDSEERMELKQDQEETFGDGEGVLNADSPEAIEEMASTPVEQNKFETLTDDTYDINSQDSTQHDDKPKNIDTLEIHPDDTCEFNISSVPTSPSRPETPRNSRQETPKSKPTTPSRPTTPARSASRGASRPTTPGSATRRSAVNSRPTTPQKPAVPHPRAQTPVSAIPVATPALRTQPQSQVSPVCPTAVEEEDIKTVFNTKQREFQRLKKELDVKQQTVLEVFDSLRNLNELLVKEGVGSGEGFQSQELVVFNVGDWTTDEIARLCRDAAGANSENAIDFINTLNQIDENTFTELEGQVSSVPSKFADLCLQAFTARQELIDWVKELIAPMEDGRGESIERITRYNDQGLELCESLRTLKACSDEAVDTVIQISRCALRERIALLSVGESLVREIARLRQDLEARSAIINEMREIRAENETAKALQETRRQLEEERAAKVATKDKLTTAESQLRQTRMRVSKMDRQLREAEASIVSLTASVKTLEDQSRQREVHLEARARKLKESLKTGEVTNNNISQQRDALQAEVKNLKEQIEKINAQNKTNVQELNKQMKELKVALEDQRQQHENEIEKNNNLEKMLADYQVTVEELKAKIPDPNENNPELPTEREIDLWAELQATKETLRMTENEVTACKREKVRFLETLTKISESDNKVGMQQKLAAELLSKEEIISKMLTQIRELTKNIKLNEQKVIQYEQYVRDLQAHKRAAANCQEAPEGISYQDLQQEIMNLKMQLLDAVHRNEELSELLSQKEQQLDQQDKTSRAQARIIKVREELINMLKNKETEQSKELGIMQQDLEHRMKVVEEVNKQIAAKAEEIQELFATLENKQQQIHRLEKIVLALEEQQRRAQAQRTRHEEKIAALEHELANGNRRDRKFLFF